MGTVKRIVSFILGPTVYPAAASADIAVLTNATTFKIRSYRFDDQAVVLFLKDGGDVTVPISLIQGFVPDEIVEEVQKAVAPAADPNDTRALAIATAKR